MKPQIYYFGSLSDGFTSYPGDYTRVFFEEFLKRSKNQVQIVIHREGNLLHYGYVRNLGNTHFGICICIDRIYKDAKFLFSVFDDIFADMVRKGDILKMSPNGSINWAIRAYTEETVALNEYSRRIIERINISDTNSLALPPTDFSISINDCMEVSLEEKGDKIVDVTRLYPNVYVVKTNAEIERVTSYNHILKDRDNEIRKLQQNLQAHREQNKELSLKLTKARIQQRNLTWVSILGAIVLILAFVIWNKVLYPSEVTHYETGEFVYYGPLKNKKPHGVGVAIYPQNDLYGRKYYIGNFADGERQDTAAILFYQDGDYYYGSMKGDKWEKGMLYMNSDDSHFKGTFKDNKAYNGIWYDHIQLYRMNYGEKIY